jgi:LCP family protein required for cell wall assembly
VKLKRIFGAFIYVTLCVAVLAVATVAGWMGRSPLLTKFVLHQSVPPKEAFDAPGQTFLILGCDEDRSHVDQGVTRPAARADMILVAHLDFEKNEISGVSIPRDTWCSLAAYPGKHRINSYFHNAPPGQEKDVTRQAVESLIGVEIDKVVVVDYKAFIRLVDMLGGIWVEIGKPLDYDDKAGDLHIHLKPGRQRLSGYDAMCYVRYRHSNYGRADSDFQRQDRQKDFLLGVKDAVFDNKFALPDILEAAKAVFGGALNDDQIIALASFAQSVNHRHVKLGTIPTEPEGSGLRLDTANLPKVLAEFGLAEATEASN